MAVVTGNDWKLTAADSNTAIWTGRIKLTSIRWSKYNGQPDVCVLTDTLGRDVYNENAITSLEPLSTTYGEGKWIDGLSAGTISSGEVLVSIL